MAEYGGKQRNQLSKVINRSESKDIQLQRFADNRPRTDSQLNLIHSIQKKPNNTGLPDNLKLGVENLFVYSMDDVKVHYNSDKSAQLNALAYTQGINIHVVPGQEKYLPHEAWHVVQQQGRVQPTVQMQRANVNDNEGLENEDDLKIVQLKQLSFVDLSIKTNHSNVCQMEFKEYEKQKLFQLYGILTNKDNLRQKNNKEFIDGLIYNFLTQENRRDEYVDTTDRGMEVSLGIPTVGLGMNDWKYYVYGESTNSFDKRIAVNTKTEKDALKVCKNLKTLLDKGRPISFKFIRGGNKTASSQIINREKIVIYYSSSDKDLRKDIIEKINLSGSDFVDNIPLFMQPITFDGGVAEDVNPYPRSLSGERSELIHQAYLKSLSFLGGTNFESFISTLEKLLINNQLYPSKTETELYMKQIDFLLQDPFIVKLQKEGTLDVNAIKRNIGKGYLSYQGAIDTLNDMMKLRYPGEKV